MIVNDSPGQHTNLKLSKVALVFELKPLTSELIHMWSSYNLADIEAHFLHKRP